jgi:hypothetical protein
MTTSGKRIRVLRNLRIHEVSGVDHGAGRGVKIMLIKRLLPDDNIDIASIPAPAMKQEAITMQTETISPVAKAALLWDDYITVISKRDGMSKSRAIDAALRTEMGREMWGLAKLANGSDVAKLGDGALPQPTSVNGGGGRVPSPTYSRGHGDSSNSADPHTGTRNTVAPDDVLPRLRDQHGADGAARIARKYQSIIEAKIAAGMSRSSAMDAARNEIGPDAWATIKNMSASDVHVPASIGNSGRSPLMLPRSHDGNSAVARGPY